MIKYIFISTLLLLVVTSLSAEKVYGSEFFMKGKYTEIREFDALEFTDTALEKNSKEYFEAVLATIKSYENQSIRLKVLGHSNARVDIYDKVIAGEKAYKQTLKNTVVFAQKIVESFTKNGLNYDQIDIDYKNTKNLGFTNLTRKGKNLSNHVIITMYVLPSKKKTEVQVKTEPVKEIVKVASADKTKILKKLEVKTIELPKQLLVQTEIKVKKEPIKETVKVASVDEVKALKRSAIKKIPAEEQLPVETTKKVLEASKKVIAVKEEIQEERPVKIPAFVDSDADGVIDDVDLEKNTPPFYIVDKDGVTQGLVFSSVFGKNSLAISEDLKKKLMTFASYLTKNPDIKAKIVGHTSRTKVSDMIYNIRLSLKRAKKIKESLMKYGIDSSRLITDGRGYNVPIADNSTEEGRMKNRRIEIEIKLPKK